MSKKNCSSWHFLFCGSLSVKVCQHLTYTQGSLHLSSKITIAVCYHLRLSSSSHKFLNTVQRQKCAIARIVQNMCQILKVQSLSYTQTAFNKLTLKKKINKCKKINKNQYLPLSKICQLQYPMNTNSRRISFQKILLLERINMYISGTFLFQD